jgi:outer membrane receptor for ferrienterochelin and colicins
MFRTPDHYGYFTIHYTMLNSLKFSLSGTYTGSMLVQHFAGYVEKDEQVETPQFFDMTLKIAYDIKVSNNSTMQVNAGIKNIFNSYQNDFDKGANRDAGFIYGPGLPRTFFIGLKMGI